MSLTRRCDACGRMIDNGEHHIELQARVLKTDGSDTQDAVEDQFGDYCNGCIVSGAALRDLIPALKSHRVEQCDGDHAMPRCLDPGCWQQ